jgi:hypothetical protein
MVVRPATRLPVLTLTTPAGPAVAAPGGAEAAMDRDLTRA